MNQEVLQKITEKSAHIILTGFNIKHNALPIRIGPLYL